MTLAVMKPVELQRSSVNEMLDQTLRLTLGHHSKEHRATLARLQMTQRTYDRKLTRIRRRQDAIKDETEKRATEMAKPPVLSYILQAAVAAKTKATAQENARGMALWDKTKLDIGLPQILQLGRISEYSNNKIKPKSLVTKSRSQTRLNLGKAKDRGKMKSKVKDDDEESDEQQQEQKRCKAVELRHFCPCYACYDRVKANDRDRPLTRAEMKAVDFVKKHGAKDTR